MLFITNGHKTLYGAVVEKKSQIRCTNSVFQHCKVRLVFVSYVTLLGVRYYNSFVIMQLSR
jgi:hypothetical protein